MSHQIGCSAASEAKRTRAVRCENASQCTADNGESEKKGSERMKRGDSFYSALGFGSFQRENGKNVQIFRLRSGVCGPELCGWFKERRFILELQCAYTHIHTHARTHTRTAARRGMPATRIKTEK